MKKYIILSLFCSLVLNTVQAQVAIGKSSIQGVSTLMEFDQKPTNTNGIILPAVKSLPTVTANDNGTFLFDRASKKVRMYENNQWIDLSENPGDTSQLVNNSTNEIGGGVIIGADKTLAKGVLVLESANKAMVLPQIKDPHLTVKNPYPGMICYDTTLKTVAVFDGILWNYWK